MTLTLHTIAQSKGSRPKSFRIGRGRGSGRGTTAGRGTKGQRARSGGRNKLWLKGMKQMLLGFPKLRGFTSMSAKVTTIPLERLESFADGSIVRLETLKSRGMASRSSHMAKIVGGGTFTKKLTIEGILVSASAKAVIEKNGGSVTAPKRKKQNPPVKKIKKSYVG